MMVKIIYNKEVQNAIENKLPLVALESTIITHGMPYPTNVETARKVEQTVRENGAVPATIAFIDGICHIGLEGGELDYVVNKKDAVKISRRDIPVVMAKKLTGGTTVAATMIMASIAGIKVFATGGIGGVHKGATETFDISADLDELSKTNVAVVCAGPKAILDLPLTLEYLETKGVVVLGYKTNKLPLFYTNTSKYDVDYCVDSPKEFADILKIKWNDLHLEGGVLITNPIPSEYSLDSKFVDDAILKAEAEAKINKIKGKNITPFLLDRLATITNNKSLESNIELVLHNAKLAAQISKELV